MIKRKLHDQRENVSRIFQGRAWNTRVRMTLSERLGGRGRHRTTCAAHIIMRNLYLREGYATTKSAGPHGERCYSCFMVITLTPIMVLY